jgi:membrane peptidoglycan carboxypeptidase
VPDVNAKVDRIWLRWRRVVRWTFHIVRWTFYIVLLLAVLYTAGALLALAKFDRALNRLNDGLYTAEGMAAPQALALGDLNRPTKYHVPVSLGDVPQHLVDAVLVNEDRRFRSHWGLDWRGLVRAAWASLQAGRVTQGGSTVTQQTVKIVLFPESSKRHRFFRKVTEFVLAPAIELKYGKDAILGLYLSHVPCGSRAGFALHGVAAAATAFYGKRVGALALAESATIAQLLPAPTDYSPERQPKVARARRDRLVKDMLKLNKISPKDHDRALRDPVRIIPARQLSLGADGYFADATRAELRGSLTPVPAMKPKR